MSLEQILQAVDQLSEQEKQKLRQYLDQTSTVMTVTAEERIRRMDRAAAAIREGLSLTELTAMTDAMNEEY